ASLSSRVSSCAVAYLCFVEVCDRRHYCEMRLFYVIKASQCLAAYAVIILIAMNRKLCGKSSLDKLLSNPNGSCSNSLQSIYMSTLTAVRQGSQGDRDSSNREAHLLPDTAKRLKEKKQNGVSPPEGKRLRIISFSCIDVNVKDLTCFVWQYADRYTVCDALTGVAIPPIIMFIEIILLIYAMISVKCEILIPSQKVDLMRTLIHCTTWLASVAIFSYVICTWETSWMNFDFRPDVPTPWLIALILMP
uniref:Uncharacterized protein n=1 Tax=Parascaris univalens TaxID=6257 RepID=A0A915A9J6_PARUN